MTKKSILLFFWILKYVNYALTDPSFNLSLDFKKTPFYFNWNFTFFFFFAVFNKQLLDEVERDIMNYQNRGLCYLPKPKAEADNTDTRF